ncbi:hypothetical protein HO133_006916 [Letharia lupina]|uniref:PKS/mFAS DH domain-containing protein n=1 Tax=Letharia lupina TaxID=560253 RepID=A0A8H6F6X3_9LECA|nr:uncharacterized protein HO133_006916 [Letharia lupina]KAF6217446.1 hypothetical protein HO133_006916 [Letharia lupina]
MIAISMLVLFGTDGCSYNYDHRAIGYRGGGHMIFLKPLEVLQSNDQNGLINLANINQPATTAIQIALVSLLASWNINPAAVVGHSSGEIAAAYAVGAVSLFSCTAVAYHRGGFASKRAARDAVDSLQKLATDADVFVRRLKVDIAYHSHHRRDIEAEYPITLGGIRPNRALSQAHVFFLTERQASSLGDLEAEYWCQNSTSLGLFSQITTKMCWGRNDDVSESNIDLIMGIGPHSSLKAPGDPQLQKSYSGSSPRYLSTLLRDSDAAPSLLGTAGALHCTEFPLEFRDLKNNRFRRFPGHELFGVLVEDFEESEPRWRRVIRLSEIPWLSHHLTQFNVVFLFAAYVSMACEVVFQRATMRDHKVGESHSYNFRVFSVKNH